MQRDRERQAEIGARRMIAVVLAMLLVAGATWACGNPPVVTMTPTAGIETATHTPDVTQFVSPTPIAQEGTTPAPVIAVTPLGGDG